MADENDRVMKEILIETVLILFFRKVNNPPPPETIPESDISGRKDFRKVLTFTIDPADAKDFDDAISSGN
jgi:hypothetical protein